MDLDRQTDIQIEMDGWMDGFREKDSQTDK